MTASYRLIDYSVRPAKFAERKMLGELLARLKVFGSLETYRYIGFGSIWFSDCVLFHRVLGIEHMVSIERELQHEERFQFNNPYRGIEIRMGESADILPGLDWSQRSIAWLDYDDPLSPSILDDIRTISTRAGAGTALIVSVQAQKLFDNRNPDIDPIHIDDRDKFHQFFGGARTPPVMPPADLRGWTLSNTSRSIIRKEIENGLSQVNAARSPGQRIRFRQVAAFEYADGAKMTTIAGVFMDEGQNNLFEGAGFRDLTFYRDGDSAFRINVPMLTPREMRHLDKSLPCPEEAQIDRGPIPEREAKHYAKLYRYLPNFASYDI
ncbi:O-methyltransferase [Novosphingobium humi]|uniref:Uncharacterized protein n=1 Tax=Novosphingobium humi TaxID=2282397 RepID=A0ABY7TVD8_9SPHN|nr:O-methyltransferase [Novosphingobium humi]WCT76315.1 hypothetical protein PQ457_10165 [Novosphingobium humi]